MLYLFYFFLLVTAPIFALKVDPSTSSFEIQEEKRKDIFDFTGDYPDLKNVSIDATRKMRVELTMPGNYPELGSLTYLGTFGMLKGTLSGNFSKLSTINFLCKSASMNLDFTGKFEKPCEINIKGTTGDVSIKLPENTPLEVRMKCQPLGKFTNRHPNLISKGMFWFKKNLKTKDVEEGAAPHLIFNIEVTKGSVTLN